jgi:hypothetical protein
MRIYSLVFAASAFAQDAQLQSGLSSIANGVTVHYRTIVSPGEPKADIAGGVMVNTRVYRFAYDDQQYFGYELIAEPVNGGRDVRVTLGPLTKAWPELRPEAVFNVRRLAAAPGMPAPLVVRSGDSFDIELLRNPKTGQRIFDRITITTSISTVARDWELRLVEPTLVVAGKATPYPVTLTGQAAGLAIPNQGLLLLSVVQTRGLERIGFVDGTTMRFSWKQVDYEIQCKELIVPGGGRLNLYGKLTPKWVNAYSVATTGL